MGSSTFSNDNLNLGQFGHTIALIDLPRKTISASHAGQRKIGYVYGAPTIIQKIT